MNPLDPEQTQWVDDTLATLSPEERLAQLLIPQCYSDERIDELVDIMEEIPFGGAFMGGGPADSVREHVKHVQGASRIPLVVAADLECGAGHILEGATAFPQPLALAAADQDELAYTMGTAAAREGRHAGIHWTFAPVMDVNLNPDNPITNTRSMGDDPKRIVRLGGAVIRGMQEHGLAACAKHFPGDGVDDLDQHAVTSVNSLSLDEWLRVFGSTFGGAFDAGAWSVMIGHIALPAWDGHVDRRGAYRPATVSRRIVTDLLRKELGFEGLVVTDDMNMGGVTGYMNRRDRTVACINAGCDMLLFPWLPEDFDTLKQAIRSGELSEQRVDDAAGRVLEFKARLNLHRKELFGTAPSESERKDFEQASRRTADEAVCCVRNLDDQLPLRSLAPGAKILTVTLSMDDLDVPGVDEELAARGFQVEHLLNPVDLWFANRASHYETVFVNFLFGPEWATQTVRCVGPQNRIFLGGFYMDHPCVIFTSFGSPYHLRMFSTLPNYINVHSSKPVSQRAAVAAWFGEIPMDAKSPVSNLTRTIS